MRRFLLAADRRPRSGKRVIVNCSVIAALLLGAALAPATGDATPGGRDRFATPGAGEPSPFFGISPQTSLSRGDMTLMRRTGIGSMRFPIYWSQSEPEPGVFDWSATDAFLISTAPYGFEVLPFVWGSPSWAAPTALRMPVRNPRQRRAWRLFLEELVARYGPDGVFWRNHPEIPEKPIRTWQIWNEENDHRFAEASVNDYARLLRGTAPAIRSVDPGAKIVLGGLYATPRIKPSMDATVFLERLYRYGGIKRDFDGVGLHPYAREPSLMAEDIAALRMVMKRHGDARSGIYLTEFGWGSQTKAAGGDGFEKGPTVQADYVSESWRILLQNRRRWNIDQAFWFTWQDIPASSTECDFCDSTGLLSLDGKPKASLRRFAQAARG